MTREEANNVNPGIYFIVWNNGTTSRACVSINSDGYRRLMCSNWTSDYTLFLEEYIEQIEKIILNFIKGEYS